MTIMPVSPIIDQVTSYKRNPIHLFLKFQSWDLQQQLLLYYPLSLRVFFKIPKYNYKASVDHSNIVAIAKRSPHGGQIPKSINDGKVPQVGTRNYY